MAAPVLPLQTQCLTCILHHLDGYPSEFLSSLPTRQRKELLMGLPPLDICRLEASGAADGVDMNEVWHVVCKLCDETDNIRLTGNPCFDKRYLNFKEMVGAVDRFFEQDSKVKGDWRTHFLTRTAQILLHSFDRRHLPVEVTHSDHCECSRPSAPEQDSAELECDCWGCGIDPRHRIFLQRLMSVPPHSNIAQSFCKLVRRSSHFVDIEDLQCGGGSLLVPFRYAKYFASDSETTALELFKMLVKGCQFRPKVLPVHCEFFYHSELYQLYLSSHRQQAESSAKARGLFAEFLQDVEQAEFYWMGGWRGNNNNNNEATGTSYEADPTIHIPKLVLETALDILSPKLDTVYIRMYGSGFRRASKLPKLDGCLSDLAPLFSAAYTSDTNRQSLPMSAPYNGLKRLHIYGEIGTEASGDVVSAVILHQTHVEGLEIMCDSKAIGPGHILDPIEDTLFRPHFRFLAIRKWLDYDYRDLFFRFLSANRDYEISAKMMYDEVVIPARNPPPPPNPGSPLSVAGKVVRFMSHVGDVSYLGVVFSWLREAEIDVPLSSIAVKSAISGHNERCFLHYVTSCRALTLQCKGSFPVSSKEIFEKLSCNANLRVLRIHGLLPFISLIDNFCKMLSAVYANCSDILTELSLMNNRIGNLPPEKLKAFFETLVSFQNLPQLSVNLSGNGLKEADVDVLLGVWRAKGGAEQQLSCFKSLLLSSASADHYDDKMAEMALEW